MDDLIFPLLFRRLVYGDDVAVSSDAAPPPGAAAATLGGGTGRRPPPRPLRSGACPDASRLPS